MSTMGYVTTLPSAQESAALILDFENGDFRVLESGSLKAKRFSDMVSFSRSTKAGYWNVQGNYVLADAGVPRMDYNPITKVCKGLLVEEVRANRATYSDVFTSTSWTKLVARVELVGASPAGKSFKFIPTTEAAPHFLQKSYTASTAAESVTSTRMMKAGELTKVRCQLYDGGAGAYAVADFDLVSGVATGVSPVGAATMTPVGDGWYLCSLTGSIPANTTILDRWYPMVGSATSFAGNNSDGYYIAFSQYERGHCATSYIPTSPTFISRSTTATYFNKYGNLVTAGVNVGREDAYIYDESGKLVPIGQLLEATAATNVIRMSEDFKVAPWFRASGVLMSTGQRAPTGRSSQRISVTGANQHNVNQRLLTPLVVGTTYTLSMFLKSVSWAGNFQMAYYDGSTSLHGTTVTPTNEWKRFQYTFTVGFEATTPDIRLVGFSNGYDGNVIDIAAVQLEVGSTATSYIPTEATFVSRGSVGTYIDSDGLVKTAGVNVARVNSYAYDDAGVLSPTGLLIESSSSNRVTHSNGTGGAWTNSVSGKATIVATENGGISPTGENNATKLEYSATIAGEAQVYRFQITGLTSGASLATSVWLRAESPKVIQVRRADSGGLLEFLVTSEWKRFPAIAVTPSTTFNFDIGTTTAASSEAGTIYLWGAQVEDGNLVSSNIQTNGTLVTRNSDVFTSSTATRAADISSSVATTRGADVTAMDDITPWYNPSEGTFETTFRPNVPGTGSASAAYYFSSEQAGNSAITARTITGNVMAAYVSGVTGAQSARLELGSAGAVFDKVKIALSISTNKFQASANGRAVISSLSGTLPAPTKVTFGRSTGGIQYLNGHLTSFRYYRQRMDESQIQILSTI